MMFALCCLVFFWFQTISNYAAFFAFNLIVVFLGLKIILSLRHLNFVWLKKGFLLGCGLFLMGFAMIFSIVLFNKELGRTVVLDYWARFLIGYVFAVAVNYDKTYPIRWLFLLLLPFLILPFAITYYGFSNISKFFNDVLSLIGIMGLVFLSAFGTTKLFGFIEKRY